MRKAIDQSRNSKRWRRKVRAARRPKRRTTWRRRTVGVRSACVTAFVVAAAAAPAGAATTAPGLSVFTNLQSMISQYGWAGLPVAASFGGLVMVLEHHQQRTGNAIQAKGYIVKAAVGCIVISLATAITSGVQSLVS